MIHQAPASIAVRAPGIIRRHANDAALAGLVVLGPLLILFLWPQGLYPGPREIDGWIYIEWARHFDYYSSRWHDTYYFVRFGWTVPGAILFSLLPDLLAKYLWALVFLYAFAGSLAVFARKAFGSAAAFVVVGLAIADPRQLAAFSRGYVDGPADAYGALAMTAALGGALLGCGHSVRRTAFSHALFAFAGGCLATLAFLHLSCVVFAIPVALLAFDRAWRSPRTAMARVIAMSGGARVAFAAHAAIYHHYAGSWAVWRPITSFLDQGGTQDGMAVSDLARVTFRDYGRGGYMVGLLAATAGSLLSLGDAALRRTGRRMEVLVQISLVGSVATFLFLQAHEQSTLSQGFHEQMLEPMVLLALGSVVAHWARVVRLPGAAVAWVALCPALLVWPRHLLGHHMASSPGQVRLLDAPALVVLLGVGVLALAAAAVRKGYRYSHSTAYLALLPLGLFASVFWAYRVEHGWYRSTWQDSAFVHWYERNETFASDRQYRDFYVFTQRTVDREIDDSPGPPPQFVSYVLGPGRSNWTTVTVNSSLMFQYTQLTPAWPAVDCDHVRERLRGSPRVVVMGESWPYSHDVFARLRACGARLTYDTHERLSHGRWSVDLVEFAAPEPETPIDVAMGPWTATNRGTVAALEGGTRIKTDDRPYGYSAVITLGAPGRAGPRPGVVQVVARSEGPAGLLLVTAQPDERILGEVPITTTAFKPYDIAVSDITAIALLVVRNYGDAGVHSVDVASVRVFEAPNLWYPVGHVDGSAWEVAGEAGHLLARLPLAAEGAPPRAALVAAVDIQTSVELTAEIVAADGRVLGSALITPGTRGATRIPVASAAEAASAVVRGSSGAIPVFGELLWLAEETAN